MKKKILTTAALLAVMGGLKASGTFIPNSNESYSTAEMHKIVFQGDNIEAIWNDGTSKTYAFSSDQRILYASSSDIETLESTGESFKLYPNPASESIYLSGIDVQYSLNLYNSSGRLIKQIRAQGATQTENVSDLAKGIYYLQNGRNSFRFIKK